MSRFINALTNFYTFIDPASGNSKKSIEGPAAALVDAAKSAGINMPDKFSGPRPKGTTEIAQEIAERYPELLKDINADTAVINVKSAEINDKSGLAPNRFYGRGPSGDSSKPSQYTGRFGPNFGSPSIPNSVNYGKKSIAPNYQYQSGSPYAYSPPVAPIKKSMGGLIKMSSIPKMSSGGPVISTVPRYNSGGMVNRLSSSSSSSVTIETLSINYPAAPGNAREFFAQVEEIARQKGIKVSSGGKKSQ